jgi:hypothetical protein
MMMGMYPLEELIGKWGRGELTVEQAIGQILLWLQWLERRVGTLEVGEKGDRERRKRERRK